jgi:hypothetical protein
MTPRCVLKVRESTEGTIRVVRGYNIKEVKLKRIIVTIIFTFLFVNSVSAQTREVFEHSDSLRQIADKYEKRIIDISSRFNYYNYTVETKELPVFNEYEKNIIGKDNFVIFWLSALNTDMNFLFLCNSAANEAIIFGFKKNPQEGYKRYSADAVKDDIFYLFLSKYLDAKWIGSE